MKSIFLVASLLSSQVAAFSFVSSSSRRGVPLVPKPTQHQQQHQQPVVHNDVDMSMIFRRQLGVLFMGRAAAVRASTKAKTDSAKAKTNGLYGKKIVMAVKQGGSPDPVANRMLADVIKQARINNVPVDVSWSMS